MKKQDIKTGRFYETRDGETVLCKGPFPASAVKFWVIGEHDQQAHLVSARQLVREVSDPNPPESIPAAPVERECACGDNFDSVSGPHDCVAGSGQPAAQPRGAERHPVE